MPPVDAFYIVNYWQDVGLCGSNGMGATSLTSVEIDAWSRLSGVKLEPWEFSALRQMSQQYVKYLHEGESPESAPPYGAAAQDFDRNLVGKKLVNAFKAFIKAGKK